MAGIVRGIMSWQRAALMLDIMDDHMMELEPVHSVFFLFSLIFIFSLLLQSRHCVIQIKWGKARKAR